MTTLPFKSVTVSVTDKSSVTTPSQTANTTVSLSSIAWLTEAERADGPSSRASAVA